MAEVNLIIKADNSDLIRKLKESQTETQKLYNYVTQGAGKAAGVIEKEEAVLRNLQNFKKQASLEDIKYYNQAIEASQKRLQSYENEGKTVEKKTDGIVKNIGRMALAYVGVETAITVMQNTLLAFFTKSEQGFELLERKISGFKAALGVLQGEFIKLGKSFVGENLDAPTKWGDRIGAALKFLGTTANLLPGFRKWVGEVTKGMNEASVAAENYTRSLQEIEDAERALIVPRAKASAEIVRARLIYNDTTKSIEERSDALLKAIKLEDDQAEKEINHQRWVTLTIRDYNEQLKQRGLLRDSDLLRLEESMAREITLQSESDQRKMRATRSLLSLSEESYQIITDTQDKIEKQNAKSDEYWKEQKIDRDVTYWEILREQTLNAQEEIAKDIEESEKRKADADQAAKDAEIERVRATEAAKLELMRQSFAAAESLTNSSADITLALLNNRLARELAQIDQFTKIKLEFARGDAAETERINKEAQEQKLKTQEEFAEKARKVEIAAIIALKAIAVAQVIMETIRANAKAVAFSPLTFGQPWVGINTAKAALDIAAIAAAAAAAVMGVKGKGFAKGGWTGDGGERDETGERIAGVVHEKEFVVKKGPANKFRDVLEAINKEDKAAVFNSFTKLSPELVGGTQVNNVTVENSGPNNRLDRINSQLYQLNRNLAPKKVKEEIIHSGNSVIIRKGNSTRVIKR